MNVCFAAACIGWMSQYIPGARQDILCRKDGTPRVSEPSGGETLSCVVIFILIYYFLMAASVWFVMLCYSWFVSFQALGKMTIFFSFIQLCGPKNLVIYSGKIREKVSSKAAYFHLVSWSVPLVLTITCMALAQVRRPHYIFFCYERNCKPFPRFQVEAQSPHGICFVTNSIAVRSGFVLAPVALLLSLGHIFLYRALIILVRLKLSSAATISASANSKLRNTIVRLLAFSAAILFAFVITLVCHIDEFDMQAQWKKSYRSFMV